MPEGGAALNGESLVRVDERLADGEGDPGRTLEMHADKSARHRRVARQEQGPALLYNAGESAHQ